MNSWRGYVRDPRRPATPTVLQATAKQLPPLNMTDVS